MPLKIDSCGRYIPRVGDDIDWRFKDKSAAPFQSGTVSEVKANGLISVRNGTLKTGMRVVLLDPTELDIR